MEQSRPHPTDPAYYEQFQFEKETREWRRGNQTFTIDGKTYTGRFELKGTFVYGPYGASNNFEGFTYVGEEVNGGDGELSLNSAYTMRGDDVNWKTLFNEFKTGKGPEYSGFGPNHPMTKDLKNSWIVGIAQAEYLRRNRDNIKSNKPLEPLIMYNVPFGIVGAGMSGLNMTEQFIGGARVSIIPSGSYTMYIVNNTTDRYSYRLHNANAIPRQQGSFTPEGTIYQRFIWFQPN